MLEKHRNSISPYALSAVIRKRRLSAICRYRVA
jgi:hypothetical protein